MANQNFDPHASSAAAKQHWRAHLKKIRQEIPTERRKNASELACQQLSERCNAVHLVLSFASFGSEIDLWPLNRQLCSEGRLILPSWIKGKGLELFIVNQINQLEPHQLGMLEPKPSLCVQVKPDQIEIALIPGLGFDPKTKYRLGYGQGLYDRLLATSSMQTWGIGFQEQSLEGLPHSAYDVPLSHILLF